MTKIAQNTAAKLSVAFVAAAMTLSLYAPAQAQSVEELQAQIAALMAQINSLQSSTGSTTGSTSCATPAAPLTMGSQGADVTALQNLLISMGQSIPAGATGYFGAQTQSALAAWQAANGVSPAAGYYGPITKAAMDAKCVPATDDEDDEGEDDSETGSDELQGEGVLETFEVRDAEDEVQEGAEDEVVMELTLEAVDGDIEVNRMNFFLADATDAGADANEEADPWDVFEEVSLWVDGEKIADFDASDEDNYLDEDFGEFRFSNIGLVLPEDEEVEVLVAVTVNSSVDGSDDTVNDVADWELTTGDVRYFDADGVATDEDGVEEQGDSEVFAIVEEGQDDDAEIESNTSSPDATTLKVEEDTAESDEYTVHIFDISVDEDSSDLELNDAFADVLITNPNVADIAGSDVIADIMMTIDGETVTGEAVNDADFDSLINATNSVQFRFEFDGITLEADTDYEVEIAVAFEGQDDGDGYENGVEISTSVTGSAWEVEGLADDNVLTNSDTSETHTLATVVPVISDVTSETDRNEAGTAGTISFEFTVEADGEDDVVGFDVNDIADTFVGTDTGIIGTPVLSKVAGDATETSSGVWTINDGDSATFALDYAVTSANSGDNGTYRITLDTVLGIEVDETSAGLSLTNTTAP